MASTYQIKVRNYEEDKVVSLTPDSTEVLARGDIVTWESNTVKLVDAEADDATWIGVCLGASATGVTEKVDICYGWVKGTATMVSGTYRFGDNIKYYTGGSMTAGGGTNDFGYIIDDSAVTTRTSAEVVLDAYNLSKFFDINA